MSSALAVYTPQAKIDDNLSQRIGEVVEIGSVDLVRLLSNRGSHLDISNGNSPAHMFTPLPEGISKSLILREFPSLYPTDFIASWLTHVLLDMGEGGELYIELPDTKQAPRHKISPDFLLKMMEGVDIQRVNPKWVRIKLADAGAAKAKSYKTIYGFFHKGFDYFSNIYAQAFGYDLPLSEQQVQKIIGTYIYSLFGVNHKGFIVNRIMEDFFEAGRGLDVLDMGGGYGLLAAELARQGHTVEITDYCSQHIAIGKEIADRCALTQQMSLNVEKIEDIVEREGEERYDIISFFGCLLYADRTVVPDIFKACMRLLRPGGTLLVHENPKGVIKPGSSDYEKCFTSKELIGLLQQNSGEPHLYNVFTGQEIEWQRAKKVMGLWNSTVVDWDDLDTRVLMCVVQKKCP